MKMKIRCVLIVVCDENENICVLIAICDENEDLCVLIVDCDENEDLCRFGCYLRLKKKKDSRPRASEPGLPRKKKEKNKRSGATP